MNYSHCRVEVVKGQPGSEDPRPDLGHVWLLISLLNGSSLILHVMYNSLIL